MLISPLNMLLAARRSMFAKPLPFDRPTGRLAATLAILATATLTGCQAIVSTEPQSQVRIIHATPDASGLDIYQGPNALAFNLGFGTVTSYIPLSPGTYTINADTAGSKQALSSAKTTFAASTQYTVLIGNTVGSLQPLARSLFVSSTRLRAPTPSTSISSPLARNSLPSHRSSPEPSSERTLATSMSPLAPTVSSWCPPESLL
jgi:hypothetical protein